MSLLNTTTNDTDARYVSQQGDPQHAGFAIKRRWERISALNADGLVTSLNDCTFYSDTIHIDRQAYTGVFIQSHLDPQARGDDAIDIEQTLTKVKAVTDSSDADIVDQTGDPATAGYTMNRAWHYINPYALDTLFPVVADIKRYTDPKGNGEVQSGTFIVSRVQSLEQNDRTYDITQDMVKVKAVTGDTSLTDPLIDRAKDVIHPFGEGTGVGRDIVYRYINLDPATDTMCMAIADTSLVARMSQNDSFTNVSRKTTTETNRTMTFWVLAQRKQRIAWEDGLYITPDHLEDDYRGRDGTIRTKTWYGIDNDCYASVDTKLWSAKDTGYSILNARLRDNDDGSDDWTQTTIKRMNDTRTDSMVANTHGLQHNAISQIHSDFAHYDEVPPTPSTDADYAFVRQELSMDRQGLLNKRWIQEKPSPSNTVTDGLPQSAELRSVGRGDVEQLDKTGRRDGFVYDQVPIGSADTAIRLLDSTTDTRYIVENIGWQDMGRGNARINRNMKRINYNGSFFISQRTSDNNNTVRSTMREWPFVQDTYADALMDSEAFSKYAYEGDTFLSIRASRARHYDGTSTVRQIGAVPTATDNGVGGGITVGSRSDSRVRYENMIDAGGRPLKVVIYAKVFGIWATAQAWVEDGTLFTLREGQKREGYVKNIGPSQWVAYKHRAL